MRLEIDSKRRREDLSRVIALNAAARDADGAFPREAFDELGKLGLLSAPPLTPETMSALLLLLAAVGRGDLSTGRIYEGHVNALFLIERFGTARQKECYSRIVRDGGVFGVWNTDEASDPLRLVNDLFAGRKNFASGVDGLSHAIVTISDDEGRRMIVVPTRNLSVDRTWWKPLGMRASGSHVVDLSGLIVKPDWYLGGSDDYVRQPWFSSGAIRFLAVQVGGMHAILDAAIAHLNRTNRADNPHQSHRLARMAVAVETGYLWLERVGRAWGLAAAEGSADALQQHLQAATNGARLAIETAAISALDDAEQAIGAAGMISPHPFERLMRDLRTYLRQPNPDGAAAAFGTAVAAGDWKPAGPEGLEWT
ncbi:MAG: acyl-CoA dehydrogenase family protein [Aliihoeflea sp.]